MKGTMIARRVLAALAVAAFAAAGAFAGTSPLVKVRVASLDAALADAQTLAKTAHRQISREELTAGIASALGLKDLSFVDFTRPAAMALPQEGMAVGGNGFVVAAPVKDAAAALKALEAQTTRFAVEGDLHVFGEGNPIYVRAAGNYLVIGRTPDLVASFDPADALAAGDLPAGSVAASIQITPIAPLLKSGLIAAKEKLRQAPAAASKNQKDDESAEPDDDASADDDAEQAEDSAAEAGEGAPDKAQAEASAKPQDEAKGAAPKAEAPANPAVSPAQLVPLMDVYIDAVSDAVDNISEIQAAIEVKGGHALLHERFVARPGTTLAGFVGAQKRGAAPEIARMLPDDAPIVVVGRWEWTDASRAALLGYIDRVNAAYDKFAAGVSDPQARASLEKVRVWQNLFQWRSWVTCQTGEVASAADFAPRGLRGLSISRFDSRPECRGLMDAALAAVKTAAGGAGAVAVETLPPSGTKAISYRIPLETGAANAAGADRVEKVFGKNGLVVRLAQTDDLVFSAFGEEGGDEIVRALARRKTGAGPAASAFAPFAPGDGIVGAFDAGTLAQEFGESKNAKDVEALRKLKGSAGRVAFRVGFDASALDLDFAMPLAMIDALAGAAAEPAPAVPETPAAH